MQGWQLHLMMFVVLTAGSSRLAGLDLRLQKDLCLMFITPPPVLSAGLLPQPVSASCTTSLPCPFVESCDAGMAAACQHLLSRLRGPPV